MGTRKIKIKDLALLFAALFVELIAVSVTLECFNIVIDKPLIISGGVLILISILLLVLWILKGENNKGTKYDNVYQIGFQDGVIFAQKWISVADEEPKVGDEIIIMYYYDGLNYDVYSNVDDNVINIMKSIGSYWRPINIK